MLAMALINVNKYDLIVKCYHYISMAYAIGMCQNFTENQGGIK